MAEPLVQAGMVRRRHAFLWVAVAALLVAGIACTCGNLPIPGLSPTATAVPPTEPVSPPGESGGKPGGGEPGGAQPGGSPSGGTINLTVHNATGGSIWYIYISPTTSSTWGDDWLGSDTLSAGETISFSVPAGSYDLRADDSSHNVVEQQMGVSLTSAYTWTITGSGGSSGGAQPGGSQGGGTITLTVRNATGGSIWYIYISPTTSSSWGDDWLGSSTLSAGESTTFSVPAGSYDLRADDSSHNVVEQQMGVSLTGAYTWTITGSGGSSGGGGTTIALTVVNQSSSTICYMRISPTSSSSWGDDWLGADTIAAGSSYTFYVPSGNYDLRAEFCGGGQAEEYGVGLYSDQYWYVTGGGSSGGGTVNLTVYNGTGNTIWYLYISPTTSSSWGDDWLGSSTLSAGESTTFTVPAGTYDLKAEGSGHSVVEQQMGVALTYDYTWYVTGTGGGGTGATLTVYNYTSSTVCYMRISPTTSSSWGDDWLGADTIPSGSSYTFYVTPGSYDLRAEYCGGGQSTQMNVSIYGNITWTLQ